MSLDRELAERYSDVRYQDGTMGGGWGFTYSGHWQDLGRWARSALGIVGAHLYLTHEFPARVLDLGCGLGTMTMSFGAYCVRAVGVDLCSRFPFGGGRCVRANALELPFASGTFSAIAALDIVEHLPADYQARLLGELRRVLSPRGRVYTTVPTQGERHWLSSADGLHHHYLTAGAEEWGRHFESHGFEIDVEGFDLALVGKPFDHGMDNYPFALRAAEVAS